MKAVMYLNEVMAKSNLSSVNVDNVEFDKLRFGLSFRLCLRYGEADWLNNSHLVRVCMEDLFSFATQGFLRSCAT